MVVNYKYPSDIEVRTHFDISAFRYELPRINERTLTGTSSTSSSSNNSPSAATNLSEAITAKRQEALFNVKLYIPSGFGDSTSSEYAEEGVVLRGSGGEVSGGNNRDALNVLADVARGVGEFAREVITRKTQSLLTSLSPLVANTISGRAGATLALSNAKIFKGSSGRTLSFVINFAPKNRNEGINMLNIIDSFRSASIPELSTFAEIFIYKFPPLFDIRIMKGNSSNQTIRTGTFFEFKTMILNSFDVRFEGDGELYTYFTDDIPTGATLSLGFESIFPAFSIGETSSSNVNSEAADGLSDSNDRGGSI